MPTEEWRNSFRKAISYGGAALRLEPRPLTSPHALPTGCPFAQSPNFLRLVGLLEYL